MTDAIQAQVQERIERERVQRAQEALRKGLVPDYISVGAQIDWQDENYKHKTHNGVWTVRSFTVERRHDREDGTASVLDLSLERKSDRTTSTVMAHFNAKTMRPYTPAQPAPAEKPAAEQQMEIEFSPPPPINMGSKRKLRV